MVAAIFGDSGAPAEGIVSPEQRAEAAQVVAGSKEAAAVFNPADAVVTSPDDDELIAYVAAEAYANSRWLVKHGVAVKAPIGSGTTPGMIPLVKREGDVWVKFVNSVMVTKDPLVIAWCEENTDKCRRSDDPTTKGWATLKSLKASRANREKLIDTTEMDADAAFPPGLIAKESVPQAGA